VPDPELELELGSAEVSWAQLELEPGLERELGLELELNLGLELELEA
jgi:hypothetical protein